MGGWEGGLKINLVTNLANLTYSQQLTLFFLDRASAFQYISFIHSQEHSDRKFPLSIHCLLQNLRQPQTSPPSLGLRWTSTEDFDLF